MAVDRALLPLACAVSLLCAGGRAQSTIRVSVDSAGVQGNDYSVYSSISADGRYVAFQSRASNLVLGDVNGHTDDVFVRDLQLGTTTLVSLDSSGIPANSYSNFTSISADGRFVAFESQASNLVPGDTNSTWDIFVRDRLTGTTTRASVDSSGIEGNAGSLKPSLSGDGRYVAFESDATNLVPGDTNGQSDVFVHDLVTGATARASVGSVGTQGNLASYFPSISADGRHVAFHSDAFVLVQDDDNAVQDVFVRDLVNGVTTRVSLSSAGVAGDAASSNAWISADGKCVAFESLATNLVVGDGNGMTDIFVHDRSTGTTTLASATSAGLQASLDSYSPSISADGRFVAFMSDAADLVPGDTNGKTDVFVHDRLTRATTRAGVSSIGAQSDGSSLYPRISASGRYVVFESAATNLVTGDTNAARDIFVRDRGAAEPFAFCFGDGTGAACPCANSGGLGRGCNNSANTGGAVLGATGSPSLSTDTLVLVCAGELPSALSIPSQGTLVIDPVFFGDGLRCVGGSLKRLYTKSAVGGVVTVPQPGDPSISARSATLGDPIPLGASRFYYTYYRDPSASFCPDPPGKTWNISSSLAVVWGL